MPSRGDAALWTTAANVDLRLSQVPPVDLHVAVLSQPAMAKLPFGDALESGPLEVGRLNAAPFSVPLGAFGRRKTSGLLRCSDDVL
jgi:hypothetical protein